MEESYEEPYQVDIIRKFVNTLGRISVVSADVFSKEANTAIRLFVRLRVHHGFKYPWED